MSVEDGVLTFIVDVFESAGHGKVGSFPSFAAFIRRV